MYGLYQLSTMRDTGKWLVNSGEHQPSPFYPPRALSPIADLNGWHWHAWNNWSRDNEFSPGEPFIFESEAETPQWVKRYCPRCRETEELRKRGKARE